MVSRRGLLGGTLATAGLVLAGCDDKDAELAEACEEAATAVEGVASAELDMVGGAAFEQLLKGPVTIDAAGHGEGLEIFDEAMRNIITVVHDSLDEPRATSLRVGWITGVLSDGTEVTPVELEPDMPTENPRRDRITAESFYAKYDLD